MVYLLDCDSSDNSGCAVKEAVEKKTKEKGEPGFERLKTQFEEARRKNYKVDETTDDILKAL